MSSTQDALSFRRREPLRISTDIPLFVRCPSDPSSCSSPSSNRNITPKTTPSIEASQFFHALCMHDFDSSDPGHLPFRKDEVLTIIKQEHSGWWAAMRPQGDRIGWIPSSFVVPLHGDEVVECPKQILGPRLCDGLNDAPLSAVHDLWLPVSEDCAALSFRLVTPIDFVLLKDIPEDTAQNRNCDSLSSLPNGELSSDHVPPTPESPPYKIQGRYHSGLRLPDPGASQLTRSASPPLLDAVLRHYHPRSCQMNDQASSPYLTSPIGSAETTHRFASLVSEDSFLDPKSVTVSEVGTYCNGIHGQGLRTVFRPADPDGAIRNIELLDMTWNPDRLAEQFCVLMHTLYATIRQNECLDWMAGHRSTDMSGLRRFFDMHAYIASWVQQSILAHNDITRQVEALDNWIRVAKRCHALRNFDSLYAIVSALSAPALFSLSAWTRCAHKRTFTNLCDMMNVANGTRCLVDIMDAAEWPSVPFVRRYLEHVKQLRGDAGSSALRRLQVAAVSTLLCHQSLSYGFGIAKSIRNLMDDELQTVLANLEVDH